MLNTLLVANRGEIACRIMRTAKALGLRTVAVHSAADHDARHVQEAEHAVDLGGYKPIDSYLNGAAVIAAALASGAQAIHPGYGFLSENPDFARACEAQGLLFIGPPASAIEAMGSKSAAKSLMEKAEVPLVPGYHGAAQDLATLRAAATQIGYPVLLKASAGGGGKGMKVVETESAFAEALDSAQREAQAAFGDPRMLVEKYLRQPRHIEIQIFADQHGHCLYLHERDCSIQRRHQKVIEEAPAPGLSAQLRQAMGNAAVRAAQAVGYVGAGTVEFLLDDQGAFFFMEMNTRLQVEHPITEAITGLDLVAWQIRVARGEPLPIAQDQVPLRGHAIEARLYAEDPHNDFLPASGHLQVYREAPAGPGRRIDSGVLEGSEIAPFYDPMLAKLIAWGETREEARLRLRAMLEETLVGGVKTNLAFLQRILEHPAFSAGQVDTGFITRHSAALLPDAAPLDETFWQHAAQAFSATQTPRVHAEDPYSPWAQASGWRLGGPPKRVMTLLCQGVRQRVELALPTAKPALHNAVRCGDNLYLKWHGELYCVTHFDAARTPMPTHDATTNAGLSAPMNGSIVRVLVEVGQQVETGAALVVLEAMKMEHTVRAQRAGTITQVACKEGELVSEGAVLIALETDS